jgi:hypothetical protein
MLWAVIQSQITWGIPKDLVQHVGLGRRKERKEASNYQCTRANTLDQRISQEFPTTFLR